MQLTNIVTKMASGLIHQHWKYFFI